MLLKILGVGEPILRTQAKKLTRTHLAKPEIQQLIDLMIKTMRDHPGVGLAAPQVGESLQIIVIEDKKDYQKHLQPKLLKEQGRVPLPLSILINPRIKVLNSTVLHNFEGCMSIQGYRAVVPRAANIVVSGWDRYGKQIRITASNYHARILQHEVDHLNGVLYIDHMISKTFMGEKYFSKKWARVGAEKIKNIIK